MTPSENDPKDWTVVFHEWEPGVFFVRGEFWGTVDVSEVRELAATDQIASRLMAGHLLSCAFLDGGLVMVEQVSPDDWDDDCLDDGIWIIGTKALRAVCDVIGVAQPPRFSTEVTVPTLQSVLEQVAERKTSAEDPARQANLITTWTGIKELFDISANHSQSP
jgi:hypothetical protein